jgi:hypothetical protein
MARFNLAKHLGRPVDAIKHGAVLSFLVTANVIDGARLIAGVQPNSRIHSESKLAGPFEVILCIYEPMNIVVTEYRDRSNRSVSV